MAGEEQRTEPATRRAPGNAVVNRWRIMRERISRARRLCHRSARASPLVLASSPTERSPARRAGARLIHTHDPGNHERAAPRVASPTPSTPGTPSVTSSPRSAATPAAPTERPSRSATALLLGTGLAAGGGALLISWSD